MDGRHEKKADAMNPPSSSQPARRRPSRRTALVLAGVAGFVLVTVGAVHAQWDRGGWHSQSHGRFERGARFERWCGNDTARYHPVVRAFVRADLRLSDAQGSEFDRLADLVLPGLEEVKREVCNDFTARQGPAPERLARLAAALRKAADTAEKAVEPSRAFYGSLNEQQKQRADQLIERRGRFLRR
jgi:hypothetical protein